MVIILNYKTYMEATGENAITCTRAAYDFAKLNKKHTVIVCPQLVDIKDLLDLFPQTENFSIWSQHVDYQRGDKETGFITVETLNSIGIKGSLINHAEHKIDNIAKYSSLENEIDLCLCVADIFEFSITLAREPELKFKYVAFEPPSLIGGNVSVSTANPDEIENLVDKFNTFDVLVGAGIKKNEDVVIAKKLGAKGILIASGYVFAQDKLDFLHELMRGC